MDNKRLCKIVAFKGDECRFEFRTADLHETNYSSLSLALFFLIKLVSSCVEILEFKILTNFEWGALRTLLMKITFSVLL